MVWWNSLLEALWHVLISPFQHLNVLWQLIPIVLMWLLLEIYFVHWHEQLGWNSALTNAITIFWISVTSLQVIFGARALFSWPKFLLLLFGMLYGIVLAYIVFRHAISEKYAFMIASPVVVHYLCIVFVLWTHDSLEISWSVTFALLLFFVVFVVIDKLLKKTVKDVEENISEHQPSQESFSESVESSISQPSIPLRHRRVSPFKHFRKR